MAAIQRNYLICEPIGGVKNSPNPIIFLHPMLCSKEIWRDIPQRVANMASRTVYAHDARCHGANKDMKDFSFGVLVNDLASFMAQQKIEKAILVGHSMGGKTAFSTALKHPEKVEKIIIVDMHVEEIPAHSIRRSIKFLGLWRDAVRSLPKNISVENITSESVSALYSRLEGEERIETEEEAYLKSDFVYTKLPNGRYDVSYNAEELRKGLEKYLVEKEEISGTYLGPAYFLHGAESPYQIYEEKESIKKFFPRAEILTFKGDPRYEIMPRVSLVSSPLLMDLLESL